MADMKKVNFARILAIIIWYWFPAILWGAFIIFLATIPDLKSTLPTTLDLIFRKIGHMVVYFVMTLFLARIGLREVTEKSVRLAAIFVAAFGSLLLAFMDENIQAFVPGRSGSVRDVGFDLIGALGAMGMLFFWNKRKKKT